MNTNEKFMSLCIDLAEKSGGNVAPNPKVAALVVKNGKIVGKGYHRYCGGPHAEVYALKQAGTDARGADLYVNLEPCCHTDKRTPPCVPQIIGAGIKKVVAAMPDPNVKVNCKGFSVLRKAGVECVVGVMRENAWELNKIYIKNITKKLPFVYLKTAMSLDGKIATFTNNSKWITSDQSRDIVHKLRSRVDAVLVGINTVLVDNPWITAHSIGENPVRVIVDPHLKCVKHYNTLNIFNHEAKTVIITKSTGNPNLNNAIRLSRREGVAIIPVKPCKSNKNRINFKDIVKKLFEINVNTLLIEGGGETNAAALEDNVVDEMWTFIAPKIVGGRNAKTPVEGVGVSKIQYAPIVKFTSIERIGQDILIKSRF
ncbi:MAG: bifunctional diaminohydroxyphosphoribosylaminopyrimidine deaminase/5-amino-6-(5-phosphoribosylamino)uracil reductase RibD [Elusimicrobiota bacterium]